MMNRSSSSSSSANPSDPYIPSIMSFAGQNQQNHLLEYWETQSQTPFFDPQPSLFPMNNFPFCSPLAAEYPTTGMIKREEIGLNLGHRTYFSSGDALTIDRLLTARAHNHQPPRCQAEGCKADLSGAKHYHRRHKVCEFHSKATVVIAGGMQQRFCQQCSRFHVLGEFDDSKRSCRKRLADHNRRRRKPQNQNPSTNSTDQKTRQTTRPPSVSKDITSSRSTTTTTIITAISSGNSGFHGGQGKQNKPVAFRSEAALSLGGVDNRGGILGSHNHSLYQYQQQQQQQQQHFSSLSNTSNNSSCFYNQSIFGSSSIEAVSQSTGGGNSDQHQSNLLHLGQAMFEVDFM